MAKNRLNRHAGKREPLATFSIYCEGRLTERRYFEQARAALRNTAKKKNGPDYAELENRYAAARERAIRLDRIHQDKPSIVEMNPSTSVWRLIDALAEHDVRVSGGQR